MSDVFSLSGGEARGAYKLQITTGRTDAIEHARNMLAGIDKGFKNAMGSTIKRTATSTKAFISKEVRHDYVIKSEDLKRRARMATTAKDGGLLIKITGTHIPLFEFDTHLSRSGNVTTRVKRTSPRTAFKHAFVVTTDRGHQGIYEREADERLPIREFMGPSVPQMLSYNTDLQDKITEHAQETFEKRLDHEVTAILNGWRGD